MAETSSTPPNQDGGGDPQGCATASPSQAKPSPCCAAPSVAPQARRGERVIVSQTVEPEGDRTEDYLRGPTAYCA
jgi:hypothetical protein